MAYDENLAERVRQALGEQPELVEKKMFGGVGYLVRGNMACGIHKDMLVVRVGPERYEETLMMPFTLPFDITGRPMKGWVLVWAGGFEKDENLKEWIQQGVDFALTLPAK